MTEGQIEGKLSWARNNGEVRIGGVRHTLCSVHDDAGPSLSAQRISRMLSGRGGLARVRMALLIIPAIVVKMNMAGGENFYNFSTSLFL